jgi:hypothetical protein
LAYTEVDANTTQVSSGGTHLEYFEQFNLLDMVGGALGVNMDYDNEVEDDDILEEQSTNVKAHKFY